MRMAFMFVMLFWAPLLAMGQQINAYQELSFAQREFIRCDFSAAAFVSCRLDRILWKDNVGQGMTIMGCEWPQLNLRDSKFGGLRASNLDLREGYFERSSFYSARLENVNLDNMRLARCSARRQIWEYCDMRESNWQRVELRGTRWENVNASDSRFAQTDFTGSRVYHCDWGNARFERGSMRGASFWGTDFSGVRLENCNIRGLVINGVNIEELLRRMGR